MMVDLRGMIQNSFECFKKTFKWSGYYQDSLLQLLGHIQELKWGFEKSPAMGLMKLKEFFSLYSVEAKEPEADKKKKGKMICNIKTSVLQQSYTDFERYIEKNQEKFSPALKKWLFCWKIYDLANSPMGDDTRRFSRWGHYVGYFDGLHDKGRAIDGNN